MSNLELIAQATRHQARTAIIASEGTFTYHQLLKASAGIASKLLADKNDLQETRVAFLVPPGFQYAATQWGIWRAGGVAVPLCVSHPQPELEYVIADSAAEIIVCHADFAEIMRPLADTRNVKFLLTAETTHTESNTLPRIDPHRRAMIVYTSGTTHKPKGVVSTHQNIEAQIKTLITAWEWTANDHLLHVLPLHHIHGIINALSCTLWAGATCEILPKFDAAQVWSRFRSGDITLFMAVPTIYLKLIEAWERAALPEQQALTAACEKMRVMISGSAALPVHVLEKWKKITHHVLLERYGMTEIGMALSNPLRGERIPGSVGVPLPDVEVRLVDDNGADVEAGIAGEILVKGPSVFLEYWRRPEATQQAFQHGWFRTGDMAAVQNNSYRILGRRSVDMIKTGGYKVSALEIEEVLRTHPDIAECAVVGISDDEWGERVGAAITVQPGGVLTLESLRSWAKERLANYKIPAQIRIVSDLPRNAMGKIIKPAVKNFFTGSTQGTAQ